MRGAVACGRIQGLRTGTVTVGSTQPRALATAEPPLPEWEVGGEGGRHAPLAARDLEGELCGAFSIGRRGR